MPPTPGLYGVTPLPVAEESHLGYAYTTPEDEEQDEKVRKHSVTMSVLCHYLLMSRALKMTPVLRFPLIVLSLEADFYSVKSTANDNRI